MTDLVVIVPSRGRPAAAHELVQAFNHTTATRPCLVFAVGEDDPTLPEYWNLMTLTTSVHLHIQQVPAVDRPSTMNHALNRVARLVTEEWDTHPFAVGFMGDDHRPRTYGWDAAYLEALRELGTGIVYGDDQLQGERLPTQVAMTADIVRALGYMAPPDLWHMYVDNFWYDLGRAADCLRYLPQVTVEHLHPLAGKAAVDDSYRRSNAHEVYKHDAEVYRYHRDSGQLAVDAEKVRALRVGAPA
jgi:hypothetical protein